MFEPLNFNLYKNKNTKLSSVCPWICMADEGIVLLKGNAYMCAYEFVAPDTGSASIGKINAIANICNNSLIQLGSNWTIQFELQRRNDNDYPGSDFKNLAGFLIEKQRELNYAYSQNHFQNRYFVIFTYLLPSEVKTKIKNSFFKKSKNKEKEKSLAEVKLQRENEIRFFKLQTSKVAGVLANVMRIKRLNSEELMSFIHSSVSLNWNKVNYPEDYKLFIDRVVTDTDLENSIPLKLGKHYIPIVAIKSFPSMTVPAMFDVLNKANCELRWSTRFSLYSKENAYKRIEQAEKRFHSARKSVAQLAMEATMKTESTRENSAAAAQEMDSSEAKVDLTMGSIGFGDYCSNVMVWDEDFDEAQIKAEEIASTISSCGFTTKIETMNALQAFLSMQPGNIYANQRELFVSTGNVSHIIPISSIWSGLIYNKHMYDVCGQSHPHLICDTDFGIPFFLNLNVKQVGHTWISGGTGAGKSTLLALLEAQWLKYPNAQVIIFDKDRSARNLTIAVGGQYLEPGKDEITFQPLADIDDEIGKGWAAEFIQMLLVEQSIEITAGMRTAIYTTLKLMATLEMKNRTITSFIQYCDYQDPDNHNNIIADGLQPYLIGEQYGSLFDADSSNLNLSSWTMIEMGTLMNMSKGAVAPALDYLFMQCEKKFDGRPTMLVLDEAWIFFKNPVFSKKIAEWLKVLRKKNVFVVFATQELEDAINSPIASTIVSQCASKIFLADDEACTEMKVETYKKFGLEDSEIKKLSTMRKQQDYFYKSALGTRCFQLGLDSLQLGILTCSSEEHELLDKIEVEFGKNSGKELVLEILNRKHIEYKYLLEAS